jgi:hypothetical protein
LEPLVSVAEARAREALATWESAQAQHHTGHPFEVTAWVRYQRAFEHWSALTEATEVLMTATYRAVA